MDRRLFLQMVGVGGIAATNLACPRFFGRAKPEPPPPLGVPTTCELCPNKCSVLATVRKGRIHKLNPNPENPKSRNMLCARGNAALQQVYKTRTASNSP